MQIPRPASWPLFQEISEGRPKNLHFLKFFAYSSRNWPKTALRNDSEEWQGLAWMCSSLTVIGAFHSSEPSRVGTTWASEDSSAAAALMNHSTQRTRWILPSALLPPAFLHTIHHVNPQPEFATYWVLMRATHPPSVNQGDQELCGPQSGSRQHSRALCVQQITGVLSDIAPPFVKWE